MQCPTCGNEAVEGARFCNRCGTELGLRCQECGTTLPEDSQYCHNCGAEVSRSMSEGSDGAETYRQADPGADVVECPRCGRINSVEDSFCFNCGLPFDEVQRTFAEPSMSGVGRPAGFWIRLGGWIMDSLLLSLVVAAIWPAIFEGAYVDYVSGERLGTGSEFTFLLAVNATYHTLAVGIWGTTVGKRLLGLWVVRPGGGRVGLGGAFVRYLGTILSSFLLLIGYLMVLFRSDRRALHDLIANTYVVRK
ncbi:MAG: RDD family protein [Dehalococcoidia bacterium]